MHELLEEVMEISRLFVPELVGDHDDFEWWRHKKKCPRIGDSTLDDGLMHRLSKLLLKGALYRLELNSELGDYGMESELHMPVMLENKVLHGPRRMLQQHLMKFVFRSRPPRTDLGDGLAFSYRELFRGEVRQDSVLRTAVGQREKQSCRTQLPTAPEPDCRLFRHGISEVGALSASLAAPCTTSDIAVDTWTPFQRPRQGVAHSRPLFSRRDSRHAKDRRRVIGFGIDGTTAMRNKCSSHVHSSFFSSCSKLNAFIRAFASVGQSQTFLFDVQGDYVPVGHVNNSNAFLAIEFGAGVEPESEIVCR